VSSYALSGDGSLLVAAVDDRFWSELLAFDTKTGKLLWRRQTYSAVKAVAVSPDGKIVAGAWAPPCQIPCVGRWNAVTGETLPPLRSRTQATADTDLINNDAELITFSADGSTLAASTTNGVFGWDARTGGKLFSIEPGGRSQALVLSADGKLLAVANDARTANDPRDISTGVWTTATRRQLGAFGDPEKEHAAYAALSADGRLLAVGLSDWGAWAATKIWRLDTKALVAEVKTEHGDGTADGVRWPDNEVEPVGFRDARHLVVTDADGVELLDVGEALAGRKMIPTPFKGFNGNPVLLASGKLVGVEDNVAAYYASTASGPHPFKPSPEVQQLTLYGESGAVSRTFDIPARKGEPAPVPKPGEVH
jgi:WD40 repeat protein